MDLVKGEDSNANLTFGVLLITLLLFALFAVYMRFMEKETLSSIKQMAIVAVLIMLSCALAYLTNRVDYRFTPILIPVMLCSLLVSEGTAYALTALLSIIFGIMAGGSGSGILGTHCAVMIICNTISGLAAIFAYST